jgi:hypothetical protein
MRSAQIDALFGIIKRLLSLKRGAFKSRIQVGLSGNE